MAAHTRRHLVEGIVQADLVFSLGPLRGKPKIFLDRMMAAFSASLSPMGALF
jgi:hypothetical protein